MLEYFSLCGADRSREQGGTLVFYGLSIRLYGPIKKHLPARFHEPRKLLQLAFEEAAPRVRKAKETALHLYA